MGSEWLDQEKDQHGRESYKRVECKGRKKVGCRAIPTPFASQVYNDAVMGGWY